VPASGKPTLTDPLGPAATDASLDDLLDDLQESR
jgi:hypothetical protein